MQRLDSLKLAWQQRSAFFIIALLVVSVDQLSKLWVRSNIPLYQSLPETGFFRLTHLRNTGASFGLFQYQSLMLIIIAIMGICFILYLVLFMYHRLHFLNTIQGRLSLGLILGGTVGNLIDRLRTGYVTDFIAVGTWPPFNVADSAIVVGAIVLAYSLLRLAKSSRPSDGQKT